MRVVVHLDLDTGRVLWMAQRAVIEHVLARVGGNITRAAKILGIDRVSLQRKMRKYGMR